MLVAVDSSSILYLYGNPITIQSNGVFFHGVYRENYDLHLIPKITILSLLNNDEPLRSLLPLYFTGAVR